MTFEQALALVPPDARNREKLAQLLLAVEQARAVIAADTAQSDFWRRLQQLAATCGIVQAVPRGTRASVAAESTLRRAVDATRKYAARHRLKPDTREDVLFAARQILAALD